MDQESDIQTLFNMLYNFEYLVPLIPGTHNSELFNWARGQTGNINDTKTFVPFAFCAHLLIGAIIISLTNPEHTSSYIKDVLHAMDVDKLNNFSEFVRIVQKTLQPIRLRQTYKTLIKLYLN